MYVAYGHLVPYGTSQTDTGFQPFGQLPLLHHGDFTLAQSHAIVRYLASRHGLHGGDAQETATIDMVYDAEQDVLEELFQLQYVKDEAQYVSRLRKCVTSQSST